MTTRRKLFSICAGAAAMIGLPVFKTIAKPSKSPEWELTNQLVDYPDSPDPRFPTGYFYSGAWHKEPPS